MKNLLAGAAVATVALCGAASAATFDFIAITDGGSFTNTNNVVQTNGEADWNTKVGGPAVGILDTASGISVIGSATTSDANISALAYFDGGSAGLGVCGVVNGSGQCAPGNDDNIGAIGGSSNAGDGTFEVLTLTFNSVVKLTDVLFQAEGHGDFTGTVKVNGVLQNVVGGNWDAGGLIASVFNFEYIPVAHNQGSTNEFYIGTATVTNVPLPAGLPLLLAGMGGLGLMRRRQRKAA